MFCYQIATSNAAQLCNELGQQTVILEGDAKQVVDAITGRGSSWSRYGHIVEDIRVMLQAFSSWECVHVSREANNATHRPVKEATTDVIDRRWTCEIPSSRNPFSD